MILPGTFSASVESINTTPQKAVLEYAIAQNLTQEAQAKAFLFSWKYLYNLK